MADLDGLYRALQGVEVPGVPHPAYDEAQLANFDRERARIASEKKAYIDNLVRQALRDYDSRSVFSGGPSGAGGMNRSNSADREQAARRAFEEAAKRAQAIFYPQELELMSNYRARGIPQDRGEEGRTEAARNLDRVLPLPGNAVSTGYDYERLGERLGGLTEEETIIGGNGKPRGSGVNGVLNTISDTLRTPPDPNTARASEEFGSDWLPSLESALMYGMSAGKGIVQGAKGAYRNAKLGQQAAQETAEATKVPLIAQRLESVLSPDDARKFAEVAAPHITASATPQAGSGVLGQVLGNVGRNVGRLGAARLGSTAGAKGTGAAAQAAGVDPEEQRGLMALIQMLGGFAGGAAGGAAFNKAVPPQTPTYETELTANQPFPGAGSKWAGPAQQGAPQLGPGLGGSSSSSPGANVPQSPSPQSGPVLSQILSQLQQQNPPVPAPQPQGLGGLAASVTQPPQVQTPQAPAPQPQMGQVLSQLQQQGQMPGAVPQGLPAPQQAPQAAPQPQVPQASLAAPAQVPVKRGRGRPKGSKNRKGIAPEAQAQLQQAEVAAESAADDRNAQSNAILAEGWSRVRGSVVSYLRNNILNDAKRDDPEGKMTESHADAAAFRTDLTGRNPRDLRIALDPNVSTALTMINDPGVRQLAASYGLPLTSVSDMDRLVDVVTGKTPPPNRAQPSDVIEPQAPPINPVDTGRNPNINPKPQLRRQSDIANNTRLLYVHAANRNPEGVRRILGQLEPQDLRVVTSAEDGILVGEKGPDADTFQGRAMKPKRAAQLLAERQKRAEKAPRQYWVMTAPADKVIDYLRHDPESSWRSDFTDEEEQIMLDEARETANIGWNNNLNWFRKYFNEDIYGPITEASLRGRFSGNDAEPRDPNTNAIVTDMNSGVAGITGEPLAPDARTTEDISMPDSGGVQYGWDNSRDASDLSPVRLTDRAGAARQISGLDPNAPRSRRVLGPEDFHPKDWDAIDSTVNSLASTRPGTMLRRLPRRRALEVFEQLIEKTGALSMDGELPELWQRALDELGALRNSNRKSELAPNVPDTKNPPKGASPGFVKIGFLDGLMNYFRPGGGVDTDALELFYGGRQGSQRKLNKSDDDVKAFFKVAKKKGISKEEAQKALFAGLTSDGNLPLTFPEEAQTIARRLFDGTQQLTDAVLLDYNGLKRKVWDSAVSEWLGYTDIPKEQYPKYRASADKEMLNLFGAHARSRTGLAPGVMPPPTPVDSLPEALRTVGRQILDKLGERSPVAVDRIIRTWEGTEPDDVSSGIPFLSAQRGYLTRSYRFFDETNYYPTEAQKQAAVDRQAQNYLNNKTLGLTEGEARAKAIRVVNSVLTKAAPNSVFQRNPNISPKELTDLVNSNPELASALGLIGADKVGYLKLNTDKRVLEQAETMRLWNGSHKLGIVLTPDEFVSLPYEEQKDFLKLTLGRSFSDPSGHIGAARSQVYVHKTFWDFVQGVSTSKNAGYGPTAVGMRQGGAMAVDTLGRILGTSQVLLNPQATLRDFVSNYFQQRLGGVSVIHDPKALVDTVEGWYEYAHDKDTPRSRLIRNLIDNGVFNGTYTKSVMRALTGEGPMRAWREARARGIDPVNAGLLWVEDILHSAPLLKQMIEFRGFSEDFSRLWAAVNMHNYGITWNGVKNYGKGDPYVSAKHVRTIGVDTNMSPPIVRHLEMWQKYLGFLTGQAVQQGRSLRYAGGAGRTVAVAAGAAALGVLYAWWRRNNQTRLDISQVTLSGGEAIERAVDLYQGKPPRMIGQEVFDDVTSINNPLIGFIRGMIGVDSYGNELYNEGDPLSYKAKQIGKQSVTGFIPGFVRSAYNIATKKEGPSRDADIAKAMGIPVQEESYESIEKTRAFLGWKIDDLKKTFNQASRGLDPEAKSYWRRTGKVLLPTSPEGKAKIARIYKEIQYYQDWKTWIEGLYLKKLSNGAPGDRAVSLPSIGDIAEGAKKLFNTGDTINGDQNNAR